MKPPNAQNLLSGEGQKVRKHKRSGRDRLVISAQERVFDLLPCVLYRSVNGHSDD
jgi:hypothetical protein